MGGLEAQSCHCCPWKGREVVLALKPELSEFSGRLTCRDEIPDDRLMTLLVSHLALTLELWYMEDLISFILKGPCSFLRCCQKLLCLPPGL